MTHNNRVQSTKPSARLLAATWVLLAMIGTVLMSGQVQAQQGFEVISPAQNTSDQENVEVLEFFWFGCPHCYAFEPSIEGWAKNKPDNTVFIRCLLYTSPSPRDATLSRMPSSA